MTLSTSQETQRDTGKAILNGLKGRCPKCGEGKMFSAFLKVQDNCPTCGEELHHQRADDFPPYLVIVIVGHIVVTLVMVVEARWDISMWAHMAMWIPLTIGLSLALLQPLKGGVVGMQWAVRMHGFGGDDS